MGIPLAHFTLKNDFIRHLSEVASKLKTSLNNFTFYYKMLKADGDRTGGPSHGKQVL